MTVKKIIFLLVLLLCIASINIKAQAIADSGRAEVGKPVPDYVFKDIRYWKTKTASIRDFRGKWLIMDFGGPNCASCIAHIPDFNNFQKEFGKQLQVLLVEQLEPTGKAQREKDPNWPAETYAVYEKIRQRQHIDLPIAFDSVLYKQYEIAGMPYIVIVDPEGIVRFITSSLTRENVADILSGKKPALTAAYSDDLKNRTLSYNYHFPLLTRGEMVNGGNDTSYLFRSLLVQWNDSQFGYAVIYQPGRLEAFGLDLVQLYRLAYLGTDWWYSGDHRFEPGKSLYGNFYYEPLLLTRDSSFFNTPGMYSRIKQDIEHTYSYSLTLPGLFKEYPKITAQDRQHFQHILQQELDNLFPYTVFPLKRSKDPFTDW